MRIRTRLVTAVAIGVIPVVVGMLIILAVSASSDRRKTAFIIEESSRAIAEGIAAFFGDARHAAAFLADMHSVSLFGKEAGEALSWNEARPFFQSVARRYHSISNISLVEPDGSFYRTDNPGNPWRGGRMTEYNSRADSPLLSLAGEDFYREQLARNSAGTFSVMLSEPFVPPGLAEKAFVTSAPIIGGGRVLGIVCAAQNSIELSILYASLTAGFAQRFGEDAMMCLVTDGGQLVSWVKYSEANGRYQDELYGVNSIVEAGALGGEALQALESARSGGGVAIARVEGEERYVSSIRIEGTPYALGLSVPVRAMLASSRTVAAAGLIVIILTVAIMVFAMLATARSIVAAIKDMGSAMEEISKGSGDLTARLSARGGDEVSSIAESFNGFIESLHGMVQGVSESARAMEAAGGELSVDAEEISADVSAISNDVESLNLAAEEQSASVTETSSTLTQIAHNIESLSLQIESQSSAAAQSSAAVEEMVSNIASISQAISKSAEGFAALDSAAADGKGSIDSVQDLVNKLSAQSDSLLEANSVIDNIAAQTNLLAMNASIEAAHAGAAGKGFAVVAGEIRSLAESSAKQSKAIAAGLKATVESIRNIAAATAVTDSSFNIVVSRISGLAEIARSVDLAMKEQNEGSRQVLEALRDIESASAQIRDGAFEMNSGTEAILKEIRRLSDVSQEVKGRSASIARALSAITASVGKIVESSSANKEAVAALTRVTGRFKL